MAKKIFNYDTGFPINVKAGSTETGVTAWQKVVNEFERIYRIINSEFTYFDSAKDEIQKIIDDFRKELDTFKDDIDKIIKDFKEEIEKIIKDFKEEIEKIIKKKIEEYADDNIVPIPTNAMTFRVLHPFDTSHWEVDSTGLNNYKFEVFQQNVYYEKKGGFPSQANGIIETLPFPGVGVPGSYLYAKLWGVKILRSGYLRLIASGETRVFLPDNPNIPSLYTTKPDIKRDSMTETADSVWRKCDFVVPPQSITTAWSGNDANDSYNGVADVSSITIPVRAGTVIVVKYMLAAVIKSGEDVGKGTTFAEVYDRGNNGSVKIQGTLFY